MISILRKILPEKMSLFEAISYAAGPAKIFMPQYKLMAQDVSAIAKGALLDIGTGPGILPLEIGKLIPSVRITGIDVGEKMIEIAQANKKKYGLTNVDFMVMDANALSFDDDAFDMVISTDSLHHWKRPARIIDEIYRCLKPGGEAWIYDGFSGASNKDIDTCTAGFARVFPLYSLVRLMLGIHGFSQKEYDTTLKNTIAETRFRQCVCEQRGVMMRVRLRKLR